ncbi:MAG TPA: pyruvate, water dikinase regulatory protein [Ferrovibrio sp.]|uniref:pyruvate, water dikinase regulatory protein n=1 Tax=Ferrovibrio sp. TaxID=1917215 RepID=UPI002B4B6914|nr:pyruvate, water dikinase regulatory protein [Ferrovibrio sp.]HLT76473.1 pyruvate, water dikinase regulatory protein [Ferrovibrio sp.]
MPSAPPKTVRPHIHLVSDATGETLKSVAKAALVQFQKSQEEVEVHTWALVRKPLQMERVVEAIAAMGGLVLFTVVDQQLREILIKGCASARLPVVPVLDPVIHAFGKYLGEKAQNLPGRQHELDAEYFHRIDAMHFTIAHDDGQHLGDLEKADIVLVGVSRTSKTPTSMYLANRGFKTANVPIVPGLSIPAELETLKQPLVVGLTTSLDRLVAIRRTRLVSMNQGETSYIDEDHVREELAMARKLCAKHNWPMIDVTRRSIEETAAAILNLHARREEQRRQQDPKR